MSSSYGSSLPSMPWPPSCSGELPGLCWAVKGHGQCQVPVLWSEGTGSCVGKGQWRGTSPSKSLIWGANLLPQHHQNQMVWGKSWWDWDPRRRCPSCSFLVSVLYSKAKLASACGGIIYFLSYVPYMYVAIREEVAHDKITAFEKCIAVSWLQHLGTCSAPGLPQAPHVQNKVTNLSPSPGQAIACMNQIPVGLWRYLQKLWCLSGPGAFPRGWVGQHWIGIHPSLFFWSWPVVAANLPFSSLHLFTVPHVHHSLWVGLQVLCTL